MQKASAIVAMGGYNTFCEILSMDKARLIVPRKTPPAGTGEPGAVRRGGRPGAPARRAHNPPSTHDPLEMAAAIRR